MKPKPMVEIAGKPILWHIMKIYEYHGFGKFLLALGYKGEVIKDYFLNYHARMSDLTVSLKSGIIEYSNPTAEDWEVDLVDTGALTMTGGRLLRLKDQLSKETFMVTYGDGVANVDIKKLVSFHKSHGKLATVTAVRPPVRFGELSISGDQVIQFQEKPQAEEGWINGGFFVFEPEVLNYIQDESTMLERSPLETLAKAGQLMAFHHAGYWQCMDTLRDKHTLEELWNQNKAPWKFN
ncbi:glucose-1-phosphate cytidylyltransferase [Leptospira interrogans str. HAI1594]|uniref:Glucose-1-phosphate cytidylyltransferase n=1 Tax=Leptospira interrogans serovar Pyrogenes str. L0374 TaxID=1049928 RepID=M6KL56_LEPIR|nr:glucose-1-phosphate cytidylyltransferase [Leptospira interrogans str. C10069]EKO67788.1 glucose-1-phosphate cytidylyltransferase [Leptospira interrogans serovar Canicola str. Fiocruz LV133]EKP23899.1 glucose-1-phosphate cytidylyltransferase [Leptospira interrogans serovar Icterohaemorrhagiae str. Verdun LP]EKP76142.1 glucose-1-phosphate cytidylyltransferase [Leptospira interrogans str. HAI1594]EMK17971.1 glucose-1-phosphate cytidylyltransferase [Leptospira interrogans str. Kito]EMN32560.1 g